MLTTTLPLPQAYVTICKEKCFSDRDIAECILPSTLQLLNGALEPEEQEGETLFRLHSFGNGCGERKN